MTIATTAKDRRFLKTFLTIKNMKILNLYSGIGGNRAKWGDNISITSIEKEQYIADAYKEMYPNDIVIVSDAHEFLIKNHNNYDFVWSSPPCPTHSKQSLQLVGHGIYRYPDMSLYQEIIFLKHFFKGKFLVENVIPYYKPLIKETKKIDRHLFWSNFNISDFQTERNHNVTKATKEELSEYHGINLPIKTKNKRTLYRNCVHPDIGLHILNCALK